MARCFLAACVLTGVIAAASDDGPADYLGDDLRARVEALKANVAQAPTNAANARERAQTLWAWINAYSLTGDYVPVNATQTVSQVLSYGASEGGMRNLDRFIAEFTLIDEQPDARGTLTADFGPFEARTHATIRQTWTVGSRAVEPGGGIVVARHFMANFGRFQTEDAGADNHVTIASSNPAVAFARHAALMAGMHGGFRGGIDNLMFRVVSGRLAPGDTVTVTYGDTSGGGKGILLPDFSSDRMPLPLYVDFDGSGLLVSLPIQPIAISGTAVAALHGFAPSVVAVGEPFDLHIRAEDRYYNRAREPIPEWWEIRLNGDLFGAVHQTIRPYTDEEQADIDRMLEALDRPASEPGAERPPRRWTTRYILDEPLPADVVDGVHFDDEPFGHPTFVQKAREAGPPPPTDEHDPRMSIGTRSVPVGGNQIVIRRDALAEEPPPRWRFPFRPRHDGAIRVVSGITLDAPGVYRFSFRSADGAIAGIANPILVQEAPERRIYWGDTHGHSGFAEGVGTAQRFMEWAREDARLDYVTHSEHDIWMDDHEWNVLSNIVQNSSHDGYFVAFVGYEWTIRNLQGGHHNVLFRRPFQGPRIPAQEYGTLSRLYQGLRTHHDPRNVVVIPHAHQSGDYRQNDPELEPLVEIMSQHGNFEWFGRMYLNHGHQVGFIAASDNHLSQPGYSAPKGGSLSQRGGLGALLAKERTTDALFDAMKNLDTYATTGDRIILDVSVNGTGMGQRAEFAEQRTVRGRVIGTAPIDSIVLVKNDREIDRRDFPAEPGPPKDGQYQLVFHSDSTPMHPGDNPRGWRGWRGELKVEDATIADAVGMDLHNANIQNVERVDATTVRFATHTRGGPSSLLLTLADVKRLAQLTLTLEEAREFGGGPPILRRHQTTPPATIELSLREASRNQATANLPFGEYTDRIHLRRARTEGPMDVTFEFTDKGTHHGDWYFIRITQTNDATAWSSPTWVGGFPKR